MEGGCVKIFRGLTLQNDARTQSRGSSNNHHLYTCISDVSPAPVSEVVIYCQLFSERRDTWVSERWCCPRMPAAGQHTIFTDIGGQEVGTDLYLVVSVYRLGKIVNQQTEHQHRRSQSGRSLMENISISSSSGVHKRPISVGVCPLVGVMSGPNLDSDHEIIETIKMFSGDEKEFHQLHSMIMKGSGKISPASSGPTNIVVKMRLFSGLLQDVQTQNKSFFMNLPETRKLGLGPVVMPSDLRNDLFITIVRGTFDRGKPGTSKNIEVVMGVYDGDGNEIHGGVVAACGGGPQYPAVFYHNNSPVWEETFRIDISLELFQTEGTHLRLEYYHCSVKDKDRQERKLMGFSWLELMRGNGTTLRDGDHEIGVYKCENTEIMTGQLYIIKTDPSVVRSSIKENVVLRSQLCSTKLTQNVDIMTLLNWRASPENIPNILAGLMKTGGEEIVKFLRDILDALFAMFVSEDGNSTPHSGQVFHALVHILSTLKDPKYEHFQPVIDTYIDDHFAAALVYKGLMSCVRHCSDMVPSTERQDPIRKCFQSLYHVFRFIITSRKLFSRATGGQNEDSFRVDIHLLFNSFNKMLSYNIETVLQTQDAFLQNLSSVYPSLLEVIPLIDVSKLVTLTLGSLSSHSNSLIRRGALSAARDAITSNIWSDPQSRVLLLPSCLDHVSYHLQIREELKLSTDMVLDIVEMLQLDTDRSRASVMYRSTCLLAENVIMPLGVAIIAEQEVTNDTTQTSDLTGARLTVALIGILELVNLTDHNVLWQSDKGSGMLGKLLTVLTEILSKPTFPVEWSSLSVSLIKTILITVKQTSQCIVQQINFDKLLWMSFFRLSSSFILSPLLNIDDSKNGRVSILSELPSNIRITIAEVLVDTWKKCPDQIQLVPSLVGPLLELILVPFREIRQTVVPVLLSMMEVEQRVRGNFKQMETELIDKLDMLINENREDAACHEAFNNLMLDLTQHLKPQKEDKEDLGSVFVSSVSTLLERLLDYRETLQDDHSIDKRMTCTANLLKFYKDDIARQELYLRYIYKLHDLHIQAHNYAEAGFTLMLHAGHLQWSTRMLHADLQFPTQQEWQRKEQLYGQIISLFDKSKLWEFAIPLCKELCDLYEKRIYDYYKLSNILNLQAAAYQNILTTFRPHPEYFKVCFLGASYPLFLRNKEFIYRGLDFEKIADFTQRLASNFPEAKIFTKNCCGDETMDQEEQLLQIFSVKPVIQESAAYMGPTVPDTIRSFYSVNKVSRFIYDRPFHKGPQDPENEFATLWIERTVYSTNCEFPGILKWFEVVEKSVSFVSPLQFACETMAAKNDELKHLLREYSADRNKTLSPLTMRLQGNIDAAVNGGVSKYRKAFFTREFCASNPSEYSLVECLAGNVEEQAKLLGEVLELHGTLAPEPLQPLHERLIELYGEMKIWMVKSQLMSSIGRVRVASIVNTPLPPVPCHGQLLPAAHVKDDLDDPDNCYHEVVIGDVQGQSPPVSGNTKIAPPLPPRGVKTALSSVSTTPLHDNYTHVPPQGILPPRLSSFHSSPPPLRRKPPPPIPPKSASNSEKSEAGSEG